MDVLNTESECVVLGRPIADVVGVLAVVGELKVKLIKHDIFTALLRKGE
jgi:hypothetical protein